MMISICEYTSLNKESCLWFDFKILALILVAIPCRIRHRRARQSPPRTRPGSLSPHVLSAGSRFVPRMAGSLSNTLCRVGGFVPIPGFSRMSRRAFAL